MVLFSHLISNLRTGYICFCERCHLSPDTPFSCLSINHTQWRGHSIHRRMNWLWQPNTASTSQLKQGDTGQEADAVSDKRTCSGGWHCLLLYVNMVMIANAWALTSEKLDSNSTPALTVTSHWLHQPISACHGISDCKKQIHTHTFTPSFPVHSLSS